MLNSWRGITICIALFLVVFASLGRNVAAEFSPESFGIGATLVQDSIGTPICVRALFKGGPAERAGLQPGDFLKYFDGMSIDGWSFDQALDYLLQPEPLPITITVARDTEELCFRLSRARISDIMAGVGLKYVKGSLGYQAVPLEEKAAIRVGQPVNAYEFADVECQSSRWVPSSAGPSLVYFWTESCSPCKTFMKRLAGQMPELENRGITVVGISLDRDCASFRAAVDSLSPPGIQMWGNGWFGDISQHLRIYRRGIPSAAHVDRNGHLIRVTTGVDSIAAMVQAMTGK